MAQFEEVVPKPYDYYRKLSSLDQLDLDIIFEMIRGGPNTTRNVKEIAEKLAKPQQTVNYRVNRFDAKDLVRFLATVDEGPLGLVNYIVIVTCETGWMYETEEGLATNVGTLLTCYPLWRMYAGIDGGAIHGYFLTYTIPNGTSRELLRFLEELSDMGYIEDVKGFYPASRMYFNLSHKEFYEETLRKASQQVRFAWEDWANTFEENVESPGIETVPERTEPLSLDYNDLLVLFHLQQNLRKKFTDIGREIRESSATVSKRYAKLLDGRVIVGCRAEIYPSDPSASLYPLLKLEMTSESALRKFISSLNRIPYRVVFQKMGKKTLFMRTMIPPREFLHFNNAFEILNKRHKIIATREFYLGCASTRAYNMELYPAFSKEKRRWMFSADIMLRSLSRIIESSKFSITT